MTESTVEKHVHSIFMKLRIPETGDDHRRVLAVIRFLNPLAPSDRRCRRARDSGDPPSPMAATHQRGMGSWLV